MEAILKRRSVRSFKAEPVSDEALRRLLTAAQWAPSGGNRQPWSFVAVRNQKKIRMIKMFCEGMSGIPSLIIAICTSGRSLLDLGMSVENIMLESVELGLGSCAIGSFSKEPVKKLLDVPQEVSLVLLLAVGYQDHEPNIRPRKSLEEIAFIENYGEKLALGGENP